VLWPSLASKRKGLRTMVRGLGNWVETHYHLSSTCTCYKSWSSATGLAQGNDECTCEQQLQDFRRANSLCFRCREKYSKDHQCKKPLQLTIHVGEHGEYSRKIHCRLLSSLRKPVQAQPECYLLLSAHAKAGSEGAGIMQFRTLVGN
jgi:hypothetical protein